MTRLNQRLEVLEQHKAGRKVISGLSHFYDLITTTDKVGGGRALLDRSDAGTTTPDDRAAVAAVPGGLRAIREHVTGLDKFYGRTL
jgi:hypothetical protein